MVHDLPHQAPAEPGALARVPSRAGAPVDELETARRRLRHLAPWHVAPMPMRSATAAAPTATSRGASEERCRRLALQVLAVQMAQARARSALS